MLFKNKRALFVSDDDSQFAAGFDWSNGDLSADSRVRVNEVRDELRAILASAEFKPVKYCGIV